MHFKQSTEDGSCEICFSEKEIEIINKNKSIFLDASSFKHYGNAIIRMVMDWNMHFNKDLQKTLSDSNSIIEGKDVTKNRK